MGVGQRPVAAIDSASGLGAANERNRVLHVIVPASVFNYAKAQAALSGLPFKKWVCKALLDSFPYGTSGEPKVQSA